MKKSSDKKFPQERTNKHNLELIFIPWLPQRIQAIVDEGEALQLKTEREKGDTPIDSKDIDNPQ